MVIVPAYTAVPEGLTFTVGQITWTTHGSGLTIAVADGTQIQSGMTTALAPTTRTLAPSTRPPLPRYEGKKIDGSDLLRALDRADFKLLEASQPDQAAPMDSPNSYWPTRVVNTNGRERL